MVAASHLDMHQAHRRWKSEDELWRDDLALWQAEVDRVIELLPHFQHALRQYANLLRKHAAAIRLYEQDFTADEHLLMNLQRGETCVTQAELENAFVRASELHDLQRRNHERLKHQHYRLMRIWKLLEQKTPQP